MSEPGQILVIDDDKDVLLTSQLVLKAEYDSVHCLSRPEELTNLLSMQQMDVILLDMNFSRGKTTGDEGFYWLERIREFDHNTKVIMMTAYAEIDLAVQAIKCGAADFLIKPWDNQKLISTVNTCLQLCRTQRKVKHLEDTQQALNDKLESEFSEIVGTSPAIQRVFELIEKVASTDANILIIGENGTGKELVARAIHNRSNRRHQPMISVDMGAVAESLFESEMFGHTKGAFTDARGNRAGRFEVASGGTLFLDEIGNVSLPMQAKLLGVLESRSVTRVGSDVSNALDIRLICATNVAIGDLKDTNRFREDLIYRINTFELLIPPLRERSSDIPLLAEHFLDLFATKYGKRGLRLSAQDLTALRTYRWPGNVRELRNAMERAVIVADENGINVQGVSAMTPQSRAGSQELSLQDLEKQAIDSAIRNHAGNLTQVAKVLGIGRATLYRKILKYDLSSD